MLSLLRLLSATPGCACCAVAHLRWQQGQCRLRLLGLAALPSRRLLTPCALAAGPACRRRCCQQLRLHPRQAWQGCLFQPLTAALGCGCGPDWRAPLHLRPACGRCWARPRRIACCARSAAPPRHLGPAPRRPRCWRSPLPARRSMHAPLPPAALSSALSCQRGRSGTEARRRNAARPGGGQRRAAWAAAGACAARSLRRAGSPQGSLRLAVHKSRCSPTRRPAASRHCWRAGTAGGQAAAAPRAFLSKFQAAESRVPCHSRALLRGSVSGGVSCGRPGAAAARAGQAHACRIALADLPGRGAQ